MLSTVKQYISRFLGAKQVDAKAILQTADGGKPIEFASDCFVQSVNIESNFPWQAHANCSWLKTRIRESRLEILAAPHIACSMRTGTITIKNAGGKSLSLTVNQQPSEDKLRIVSFDQDIWVDHHEAKQEFFISANDNWHIHTEASWINVDEENRYGSCQTVKLKIKDNDNSKDARQAPVVLSSGGKEVSIQIKQRGKKTFDDATHYFYVHKATLPMLYSGMKMLMHDRPSYLIDYRNTLDHTELPKNINILPTENATYHLIEAIRKIEQDNPEAVYAYYTDDMRVIAAFQIFSRLGIDASRVKISMITDGASTYIDYIRLFSTRFVGAIRYTLYHKRVEKLLANYYNNSSFGTIATDATDDINQDTFYTHLFARQSNVRHYIVSTDYLISFSRYLKLQIAETNYITTSPRFVLAQFPEDKRELFYKITRFDLAANEKLLERSNKKNMIVIGTTTTEWSPVNPQMQEQYIQAVMDRYSDEYNIFLKLHPEDERTDYEQRFPGIKLIQPKTLPFDLFVWALNDKIDAMGGFIGTVFINLPVDKVKFMFARDAESLGSLLYYEIFENKKIDWIRIPSNEK